MRLIVSTPARELELDTLVGLRFLAPDGWRGILPRHEPTRARLVSGPVRCRALPADAREPVTRWVATEGGLIFIDRVEARILTPWATVAETLANLREQVQARDAERRRLEQEARILGRRHELATRRALVALERKISRR